MFGSQFSEPCGSLPGGLLLTDANGDGLTDIFVANRQSSSISVITNDGLGTWSQPPQYAVNSGAQKISVADFNGDGNKDVGVVNYVGSPLSILMGRGDGTFAPQSSYTASTPRRQARTPCAGCAVVLGFQQRDTMRGVCAGHRRMRDVTKLFAF